MTADDPRASVELRPAYVWTCTSCGRDNVYRPGTSWVNRTNYGGRTRCEWVMIDPVRVVCIHCGLAYDMKQEEA
jgi:hypothetical protein